MPHHKLGPPVPVTVFYDGNEQTVYSGDCFDFEAKKVRVKPQKELTRQEIRDGFSLHGEIHVIN